MVGFVFAAALAVSSQVTDVTVYNDRAQVVREAHVTLQSGINTLRFEDLPDAVDSRGIQVDGAGAATVVDVRFKTENFEEIPQDTWKALYAKQEALQEEETVLVQRIALLRQAKTFLLKISSKVTHTAEKEGELELNPENWLKMLDLYTEKNAEYDQGIRAAELELKDLHDALAKVKADIRDAGAGTRKKRRVVEVDLDAEKAGAVELKLSYLVRGPKWIPTYDVRVDTATRQMDVNYFALVQQNTGEDWSGVTLKLSTANPGLGGQHPTLEPWRIRAQQPAKISSASWSSVGRAQEKGAYMMNSFSADSESVYGASLAEPAPVQMRKATVQKGVSVVFEVKGDSVINSDNVEHRVAVAQVALPAHFRYSAIPRIDPHAYLKAKAMNAADYPLLEGSANIFLDGSYVATSTLELVAPEEEFWVFLGADESMKVEHKLMKRYQSREGLGGRVVRHRFEYLFTLKNTHAVPEEIIIWDQLPISETEGITVKLQQPKYSKDTDALKMDDEQRIQWFRTLAPGEEVKLPFSFYVDAPKGLKIDGLE